MSSPALILCAARLHELEAWSASHGLPAYRARQIHRQIYQRGVLDPAAMTDLPAELRTLLKRESLPGVPTIAACRQSADGTRKLGLALDDGQVVEGVLIPMHRRGEPPGKITQCVSTQVGCTLDCTFCLTGTMGLLRNLSAAEIVGQVLAARAELAEGERVTHWVYMGMGEPLANYKAVVESISVLTEDLGVSPRRITVSTAGLAHRIVDFVRDTEAHLAVSLNATTDSQRARIMPRVHKRFPLGALMEACTEMPAAARRRLTFEYVLLAGENDSPSDARRLVTLVAPLQARVNLIPFNPHPGSEFARPLPEQVRVFQQALLDGGVRCSVRQTKGDDVLGACGQLGVAAERATVDGAPHLQ